MTALGILINPQDYMLKHIFVSSLIYSTEFPDLYKKNIYYSIIFCNID